MGMGSNVGALLGTLPSNVAQVRIQASITYMCVEFVVGSLPCFERFFSGYSGFPFSSKPILSKSSSICSAPLRLNQFSKTAKCFVGRKHLQLQKSVSEFAFIMLGSVLVLFYPSTAEDVVSVSVDLKNREVTGLHTLINNQKVIQSRILFLSHNATYTTHLQYKHHEKECFIRYPNSDKYILNTRRSYPNTKK